MIADPGGTGREAEAAGRAEDERHDAASRAAHLLGGIAARLEEALPELARVADEVGRAWPDRLGREWAERASLVHRALLRDLDAVLAGLRAAQALQGPDTPRGASRAADRGPGPRLGDTGADRSDDERGMRIATLGEPG